LAPHWGGGLLRHGKNKKNKNFLNAIGVSNLNNTTVWCLSYGIVKFGTEQHTASI
jgi:hypothetical protein